MKNYENNKKIKLIALAAMIATLICAVLISLTYIFITNSDMLPNVSNSTKIEAPVKNAISGELPAEESDDGISAPELEAKATDMIIMDSPKITGIKYWCQGTPAVDGVEDDFAGSSITVPYVPNADYEVTIQANWQRVSLVKSSEYTGTADNSSGGGFIVRFSAPSNAGGYISIDFKTNYPGSYEFFSPMYPGYMSTASVSVHFAKVDMSNITIEDIPNQIYTGSAITPSVTAVHYNNWQDEYLVKDTDYTVSFTNNTAVGTATVTLTGKGNYTGKISKTFKIVSSSYNIANCTLTLSYTSTVYDGTEKKPSVTLKNGTTIVSSSNYTVSYTSNVKPGTATVRLTGAGSWAGTKSATFTISKYNIANSSITLSYTSTPYTGSELKPTVTIKMGTTTISSYHYDISYSNNTAVGTATVTVTAKSTSVYYTGSKSTTFTIARARIDVPTLSKTSTTWSASSQTFTLSSVSNMSVTLPAGWTRSGTTITIPAEAAANSLGDYYMIKVTPDSNHCWSAGNSISANTLYFSIGRAAINKPELIDYSAEGLCYSTSQQTVTLSSTKYLASIGLPTGWTRSGTTITIPAETAVGHYGINVTPDSNHCWGDNTTTEETIALSINRANISLGLSYPTVTYGSNSGTPTVTGNNENGAISFSVAAGTGNATINASTGVLTPTQAGTVTVTVSVAATTNYNAGSKSLTLTINPRNISNATFGTIDTQYYNKGAAITPTPTITDTNISKTLVDGTDFTFSYSDNINAGTATITVTGKGNYTGTKSTTFTISGSLLSNATIGEITSQTYDGTEKKPTATVTLDGVTLSSGTDFTFSWSNNVNAGTATLTITGKGNYAGTNSKTFEISARSISNATAGEIAAQGYTASAKTPLPALTDLGRTLTKDTDYTLEYADNVNVGTAKITITGKGNYNGTKEVTFTIIARNISGATVPAIPAQTYTGSAIEPLPEVTDLSITLVRGTDFTVTYKDNVNVGTATLILTGMGNYTGTKEIVFSIQPPTVADATVTISETTFTYDGSAKEPRVTLVQIGGLTLRAGVDFTVSYSANVNAGTAKVIVTGAGDYVGTKEVTFTINPADIANATLNGLQLTYVYTGLAISPEVTVTMDGVTLVLNTDYLITYSDNINVGTATVAVAGSKNYTGTLTDTFIVIKADISPATVTGIEGSYEYTGSAIAPEPAVTWSGTTLVKDTDYTLSYADNTALGTATVTITGIGNFSGTITKTFEIVRADISTAEISGINASYDFTGSAITPEPAVTFNGVTLVKDTDYTVGYADNVNTGTATVTITGCGNYTGVITKNFVIGEADMDGVTVTGIDPTYEYTGSAIAPEPTVTYNGITLVKDTDYTVEYSDNIGLGAVTVTITGCGNFNSVTTATFEIVQANIANATVTGVNESYEYTGSAITPEPVVTLNGVTLEKNVDYTVSYVNNTVTGTAVVNLTGTGNYTGINSAVFNIVRADISDAEVTGIAEEYQWTGSEIIPAPTVVLNGVTLVQNTDYVVICDGNVEVGTVTYTITAVGYYTGSIGGTFEIVKATPQVEVTYTDYNGINTLFVGDALPAITATATYNGATVSGIVSWETDGGVAPALKYGENDYAWTFTPDDTDHYAVVTGNKTLTAEEPTYADIRVEWKDGAQPELFTSSSVSVILKNLKVTGIFNNGTENEIIGSFTFVGSWDTSGAESTAAMPATGGGNYYITVKFGRHSKPVYDIKIDDVVLEELVYSAADGGEIKTDYTALDGFDTASVKVTAKYNDGSEKVLPSGSKGYAVAYENGADSLQFGDTKVTLSYAEAGVTETVEIGGLTVSKKPFDDTVLTFNPADADYDFGNSVTGGVTVENLPDWLKVTYVYEDEEGNILDPSAVKNAGTYKVTAKFTVDNNHEEIDDITATFTINKIDPVLTPAVGGSLAAGTQLGDLTFSAGNGATAGTLVWDDGAYELKEGINRCYYTFTPDDTVNFKVVHGYVDVMAEVPAPEDISGGSLVGWQIALIVVSIAVAVLALIALIVALKSRRVTTDSDGFYDDATEEDLKN